MEIYEYKFRWLDEYPTVEKVVYADNLTDAKAIVHEEWPNLNTDQAHIERIKGNGEPEQNFPPAL